jgi:purine-binding chemotaxis protein CheW
MTAETVKVARFNVGPDSYAVDIMQVEEIIRYRKVTPVRKAPEFIEGIIYLRERPLPVVDMRKRLELPPLEHGGDTRIIIVWVAGKAVGLVVDSVSKIISLEQGSVQPSPGIVRGIESEYLKGVFKDGEELVMILDMETILTTAESVRLSDAYTEEEA